jgi:MEDS: MEthanogen/methylotroph, DcmR Sensory domain
MKRNAAPISLAGSQLGNVRHVCAFFSSNEEAYRVLLPFIQDGFACGDKAVHIVNPEQRPEHMQRLTDADIDTAVAEQGGQLEVRTSTEIYLKNGVFDQDKMLEAFEQMASGNVQSGFPVSRIVCHMEWASEGQPYIDDLVEFEARVNEVWQHHDDAVICTYNLEKFGGEAIVDILRTHPMVILGGILQPNPFFVPPTEFLDEVRARRAGRAAKSTKTI